VRGDARRFELEADETAVGDREPELGRLDDDRRVGADSRGLSFSLSDVSAKVGV
jgi:hypothetical protein